MKRIVASVMTLVALLVVTSGATAVAQFDPFSDACNNVSGSTVCEDANTSRSDNASSNKLYGPNGVLTKAISVVSIVVGIAAVFVVLLAGLRYITAGGEPGQITNAKNTAKYAVVGVLVALFAQAIIRFVFNKL